MGTILNPIPSPPHAVPDLLLASQSLRVEGVNLHNGSGVTATVSFTVTGETAMIYAYKSFLNAQSSLSYNYYNRLLFAVQRLSVQL